MAPLRKQFIAEIGAERNTDLRFQRIAINHRPGAGNRGEQAWRALYQIGGLCLRNAVVVLDGIDGKVLCQAEHGDHLRIGITVQRISGSECEREHE